MVEEKEIKFEEYYEQLSKKYKLPKLDELEEDFDVSKFEKEDAKFLARSMRRIIAEKIGAYSHFFEMLINPSSPPVFIYSFLKNITAKQKDEIKKIYEELAKVQVTLMKLDTVYSEKAEIDFINSFFHSWQKTKKEIYDLMTEIETSFVSDPKAGKRSYLG
jgi:hypothetical protein